MSQTKTQTDFLKEEIQLLQKENLRLRNLLSYDLEEVNIYKPEPVSTTGIYQPTLSYSHDHEHEKPKKVNIEQEHIKNIIHLYKQSIESTIEQYEDHTEDLKFQMKLIELLKDTHPQYREKSSELESLFFKQKHKQHEERERRQKEYEELKTLFENSD